MKKRDFCVIIPAIKKNATIPDQLVRKLNGITLIQRAINMAKELTDDQNIFVVTDSMEITLICDRNHVNSYYKQSLNFKSQDLLTELKFFNIKRASEYEHLVIYRASAPLVGPSQIRKALRTVKSEKADILVTVKEENHRIWKAEGDSFDNFFFQNEADTYFTEIRAFMILSSNQVLGLNGSPKVIPEKLDDNAIEIITYQDWWICEKLLSRKRILFVITGNTSIGMGHIYRSLTLAHEINDHEVIFLCVKDSELAVQSITQREYKTRLQKKPLLEEIIEINPDLVIHDILNTDKDYILALKDRGFKVLNFEDLGSGAAFADLTINELYEKPLLQGQNIRWGKEYFLLRDEFLDAKLRPFKHSVNNILMTFGGTDPNNYSLKVLKLIMPVCMVYDINVNLVIGSGYTFKDELFDYIDNPEFSHFVTVHSSTPVMSKIMEQCDVAIAANGRTVFELAHMRIPSIILSHYEREESHDFAAEDYGFISIGQFKEEKTGERIQKNLIRLITDLDYRRQLYENSGKLDFVKSKQTILGLIAELINHSVPESVRQV
jgi:spore coat polysaccharide biosynthesis predicted glycosyltransferase SpsG/CMP-N-acetylneuraminic acid synthetase